MHIRSRLLANGKIQYDEGYDNWVFGDLPPPCHCIHKHLCNADKCTALCSMGMVEALQVFSHFPLPQSYNIPVYKSPFSVVDIVRDAIFWSDSGPLSKETPTAVATTTKTAPRGFKQCTFGKMSGPRASMG